MASDRSEHNGENVDNSEQADETNKDQAITNVQAFVPAASSPPASQPTQPDVIYSRIAHVNEQVGSAGIRDNTPPPPYAGIIVNTPPPPYHSSSVRTR